MLYLLPVNQIVPGTFQILTNNAECLEHLAKALRTDDPQNSVNLCLSHTHCSQNDSYIRHRDWILTASREERPRFLGIPVTDYEKWSDRLTETECEDGVVLATEKSKLVSGCFSADHITLKPVTELFVPCP